MKKIVIIILLIMVTSFYSNAGISKLSATYNYKVKSGDTRDYTFVISKVNGVETEAQGKITTVKVTGMKTAQTFAGSFTYPEIEVKYWNGTTVKGLTSTNEIIKVPDNLDDIQSTGYADYLNNSFSYSIDKLTVNGNNLTLHISMLSSQNSTILYDLKTGWMISIHSISYLQAGNITTVFSELLIEDLNYGKNSPNTINVSYSQFFVFAIPVFVFGKKILKRKLRNY